MTFQREQTFEALSKCQHGLLLRMGDLFNQSSQQIAELKDHNAEMKTFLETYIMEEAEMEKVKYCSSPIMKYKDNLNQIKSYE